MGRFYCCVPGCSSNTDQNVTFFRIPNDRISSIWLKNCQRTDLEGLSGEHLHNNYKVCNLHFEDSMYSSLLQNRIKKAAIPTLFTFKAPQQNVEEEIILPPFKKIKLGHSPSSVKKDSDTASLDEPKIKIGQVTTAAVDLDLELPKSIINKKPMQILKGSFQGVKLATVMPTKPLILRKVPPPKGVILKQIKTIAASQAKIVKNLKFAPHVAVLKTVPVKKVVPTKKTFSESISVDLTLDEEDINTDIQTLQNKESTIISDQNTNNKATSTGYNKKSNASIKGTPPYCRILGCIGEKNCYFPAPSNLRTLNIWRNCIEDTSLQSGDLVCNEHFLDVDIAETPRNGRIGVLKDHVVPSIREIDSRCAVPLCENNKSVSTSNMYPVPVWSNNYITWVRTIGSIKYKRKYDLKRYRVCERHFSKITSQNMFDLTPTENLPALKCYEKHYQELLKQSQGGKQKTATMCAYLSCYCEKDEAGVRFTKFPKEYGKAVTWLTLCNRGDILMKSQNEIEKLIGDSHGVCFDHYKEIFTKISSSEQGQENRALIAAIDNTPEKPRENFAIKVYADKTLVEKVVVGNDATKEKTNKRLAENEETYVPMREYCAFINCSTYIRNFSVKKYKFPGDPDLLREWINASGVPDYVDKSDLKNSFVCGKHFTKAQFTEWQTLKMSSVPVPYDLYDDPNANNSSAHWVRKQWCTRKKSIYQRADNSIDLVHTETSTNTIIPQVQEPVSNKCCIKHCQADEKSMIVFNFPVNNQIKFDLWVKAVENRANISATMDFYRTKKICSEHFEKKFLRGENLLSLEAIPTLKLLDPNDPRTGKELDTDIVWKEFESDIFDQDDPHSKSHIKGKVILHEDSIEFPNLKRKLKFGKDCPKNGLNRFPFKLYRVPYNHVPVHENVRVGHKLQIHTAIVIDDDDETESRTIDMISEIFKNNEVPRKSLAKKRRIPFY